MGWTAGCIVFGDIIGEEASPSSGIHREPNCPKEDYVKKHDVRIAEGFFSMVGPKMDIPILGLVNAASANITLLIEPHLEKYILRPEQRCTVFYYCKLDNTDPNRTLDVAYLENEIVVYAPSSYAPRIEISGQTVKPGIA